LRPGIFISVCSILMYVLSNHGILESYYLQGVVTHLPPVDTIRKAVDSGVGIFSEGKKTRDQHFRLLSINWILELAGPHSLFASYDPDFH